MRPVPTACFPTGAHSPSLDLAQHGAVNGRARNGTRSWARCAATALLLVAAGCAAGAPLPGGFSRWLDEAPEGMPLRLTTDGDQVVGLSIPMDHHQLPAILRRVIDAIVPGGEVEFFGRELGQRDGWRMEKRYPPDVAGDQVLHRSVVVAPNGAVLERSHQITLGDVPQPVLRGALEWGRQVERADVVQGEDDAEWFRLTVRNPFGWRYLVDVDTDGSARGAVRVKSAEVRGTVN